MCPESQFCAVHNQLSPSEPAPEGLLPFQIPLGPCTRGGGQPPLRHLNPERALEPAPGERVSEGVVQRDASGLPPDTPDSAGRLHKRSWIPRQGGARGTALPRAKSWGQVSRHHAPAWEAHCLWQVSKICIALRGSTGLEGYTPFLPGKRQQTLAPSMKNKGNPQGTRMEFGGAM